MTTPEIIYAIKQLRERVRELEENLKMHTHPEADHPSQTGPAEVPGGWAF